MIYQPEFEGIDHINIYSKSKLWLGQELSNFTYRPIEIPEHGHFDSIEGYWYWLTCHNDQLRTLSGFEAKKVGRKSRGKDWCITAAFMGYIKQALRLKISSHPDLQTALKESTLPFTHYYVFFREGIQQITPVTSGNWLWHEIDCIRAELRSEPHPEPMIEEQELQIELF